MRVKRKIEIGTVGMVPSLYHLECIRQARWTSDSKPCAVMDARMMHGQSCAHNDVPLGNGQVLTSTMMPLIYMGDTIKELDDGTWIIERGKHFHSLWEEAEEI